jgi:hypothetical protein
LPALFCALSGQNLLTVLVGQIGMQYLKTLQVTFPNMMTHDSEEYVLVVSKHSHLLAKADALDLVC